MTALAQILTARIMAQGPMPLSDYMAECLLHPQHGYYTTRPPFGVEGDFTTAPEISQMFGELLGLCLAQAWLDQGAPVPFTLAEVGPGRGTLMADILRATRAVPGFHGGMRLRLVEASPRLRALQAQTLQGYAPEWVQIADLQGPLYLVANEFFDALPIRQFQRSGAAWRERLVGLGPDGLTLGLGPVLPVPELTHRLTDTTEGQIVETCPQAPAIAAQIAARLIPGLALILDYGGWHSLGDTFQALRAHAPVDPFATPGEADLTAHVDFEPLTGACAHAYTTQGALLTALGIEARSARLAQRLTGAALQSHLAATRRLTSPAEMGTLFKVLALFPHGAPQPPGFPDA
ncbi:SAM-dependent methyltransferase [Rhodobacter sp. KR11]|uniref:class I SAM-dependent methyltransferase n=1 Tax=Rhodobacter sp. KR11 TaxID=2974588 RepID=UPI002222D647|nr:SAM-dependent methyltransferase [Rhodobacter sp. KR11]MCW1918667.1 SAM-dependent methyltransferase [Rhodobacter sp. KR11]